MWCDKVFVIASNHQYDINVQLQQWFINVLIRNLQAVVQRKMKLYQINNMLLSYTHRLLKGLRSAERILLLEMIYL